MQMCDMVVCDVKKTTGETFQDQCLRGRREQLLVRTLKFETFQEHI